MTTARTLIPDLGKLQAFESAARHGSITQAGKELHLTQSAVSRQIRELEAQLGLLLFERVRQRVVLSRAGEKFLPDARRLLAQSEAAMLRAMATSQSSQLSLATLPTFGSRWLVPRLPGFLARHPGVTLSLASRSAPFDLEEQGFDAAIHYGQPIWANADCRYVCQEVIVPVASPDFLAGRALHEPASLAAGPLLHLSTRPKAWASWFEASGVDTASAYQGHRFDQFTMLIEATVAGMGLALLPRYLVEKELRDKSLAVAMDRPLETENAYYFVVPLRMKADPLTNLMFEWMIEQIGPPRQG
ncbi:LysR family transcriptional regulator [Mesorhizobium sp. L-8-10]|uniref:LysR family transcriptional regulator n=1 Tax=Mesorhizobium sp. L-8-10 TaxID=2744523 RepID=UPI001925D127|nr:LysR family transcriptional regulator [Mesorhizobium sp. L-8-10]BCH31067.1 LysR family transcriptional regulator [Mesorhizobium sp. L-8-10]